MYKINDLIKVNEDEKLHEIAKDIKEFLESNKIKQIVAKTLDAEVEKNEVQFQGSYKRHTASFIGKSKSDIDIIMYISNYSTSNDVQYLKDKSLKKYKEHMNNHIKENLLVDEEYKKDKSFRELDKFVQLKKEIFNELNDKYRNYFDISNNNKCIQISNNEVDIDIVIAGKWDLKTSNATYKGSNVIINKFPYEIQNLPDLNFNNIKIKHEKCEHLYEWIRLFKNINKIKNGKLSSYHVECIIYNVDNNLLSNFPTKEQIYIICEYIENKIYYFWDYNEINETNEIFILNKKITKNDIWEFISIVRNFVGQEML